MKRSAVKSSILCSSTLALLVVTILDSHSSELDEELMKRCCRIKNKELRIENQKSRKLPQERYLYLSSKFVCVEIGLPSALLK